MHLNRRLLVISLGIVVALAILAGGAFVLNKWSSQPANSPPSAGNSTGGAEDDPIDLPDTGLVQLTTPYSSTSYYLKSINSLTGLGTKLGTYDRTHPGTQDHLVILDFGYPVWRAQGTGFEYGVQFVDDTHDAFQSMTTVTTIAVNFASEYYLAVHGTDPDSHVRLVIGLNNCCWYETGLYDRFAGHGWKWADTVNTIKNQIASNHYDSQVDIKAGMDIEQAKPVNGQGGGGGDPAATYLWLNAYRDNSSCSPTSGMDNTTEGCFYNFGTWTGSRTQDPSCHINPPPDPTVSIYDWNDCDAWYMSWGVTSRNGGRFARPVPEIYHRYLSMPPWGTDAYYWHELSRYSNDQQYTGPMFFVATLTERTWCKDTCADGNNYPWEGFQLLSRALATDALTRQGMHWSTDITHLLQ